MNPLLLRIGIHSAEFTAGMQQARKDLAALRKSTEDLSAGFTNLKRLAVTAFGGWGLRELGKSLIETGVTFDRMSRSMNAVFESAVEGQQQIKWLRQESDRLGLVYRDQVKSFQTFAAAARVTNLTMEQTRKIFTSVNEASVVLGLTQEKTKMALYALEQMMSKGVVAMEELRRQLGDHIPGAFARAAKAMGLTTEQMIEQVRQGKILSEDMLPRLAREFTRAYGEAVPEAAKAAYAEINRLKNEMDYLRLAFMDSGGMKLFVTAVKEIVKATKEWREANNELMKENITEWVEKTENAVRSSVKFLDDYPWILKGGIVGVVLFGKAGLKGAGYTAIFTAIAKEAHDFGVHLQNWADMTAKGMYPKWQDSLDALTKPGKVEKDWETYYYPPNQIQIVKNDLLDLEMAHKRLNESIKWYRENALEPKMDGLKSIHINDTLKKDLQELLRLENEIERAKRTIYRLENEEVKVAEERKELYEQIEAMAGAGQEETYINPLRTPKLDWEEQQRLERKMRELQSIVNKFKLDPFAFEESEVNASFEEAYKMAEKYKEQYPLLGDKVKEAHKAALALMNQDFEKSLNERLEKALKKEFEFIDERAEAEKKSYDNYEKMMIKLDVNQFNRRRETLEKEVEGFKILAGANEETQKLIVQYHKDALAIINAEEEKYRQDRLEKALKEEFEFIDERVEAEKKALKKQEEENRHFTKRVTDFTADFFFDIYKGNIDGWTDMLEKMTDLFAKALAEMAAKAAAEKIIVPIVYDFLGGLTGGAVGNAVGNISAAASVGAWVKKMFGGTGAGVGYNTSAMAGGLGEGAGASAAGGYSATSIGAVAGPFLMAAGAVAVFAGILEHFNKDKFRYIPELSLGYGDSARFPDFVPDAYQYGGSGIGNPDAGVEGFRSTPESWDFYRTGTDDQEGFYLELETAIDDFATTVRSSIEDWAEAALPYDIFDDFKDRLEGLNVTLFEGGASGRSIEEIVAQIGTAYWDAASQQMALALGQGAFDALQNAPDFVRDTRTVSGGYEALGGLFHQYEEGGFTAEEIIALSNALAVFNTTTQDAITTVESIYHSIMVATGALTKYDQEVYNVNQQFDGYIEQLRKMGAAEEYITWVEERRAVAIANITTAEEESVKKLNDLLKTQASILEGFLPQYSAAIQASLFSAQTGIGMEQITPSNTASWLTAALNPANREQFTAYAGSIGMEPSELLQQLASLGQTLLGGMFGMIELAGAVKADIQGYQRKDWGTEEYLGYAGGLATQLLNLDKNSLTYWADSLDISNEIYSVMGEIQSLTEKQNQQNEQIINSLEQSKESLTALIDELTGGSLSPVQSAEYYGTKYTDLLNAARNAAPEDLPGAISKFESFAREYAGFMGGYSEDYKEVARAIINDVMDVRGLAEDTQDLLQQQIADNTTDMVNYLSLINTSLLNLTGQPVSPILPGSMTTDSGTTVGYVPAPINVVGATGDSGWDFTPTYTDPVTVTVPYSPPVNNVSATGDSGWNFTSTYTPVITPQDQSAGNRRSDILFDLGMTHAQGVNYTIEQLRQMRGYDLGGFNPGVPAIFGENGSEWAIPASSNPRNENFLKSIGIDPDEIGKSIAKYILQALPQNSNQPVQIAIDGQVIASIVMDKASKNPQTIKKMRRIMEQ